MKNTKLLSTTLLLVIVSLAFVAILPAVKAACGDGECQPWETCSSCAEDCGSCAPYCGDHYCDTNENCNNCPGDCGTCPPNPPSCNQATCSAKSGWVSTGTTQWVSTGQCTEKQQVKEDYRSYSCVSDSCTYSTTSTRWTDTGSTRNKPDTTTCDDGLFCTTGDKCSSGSCHGTTRDCSANNLPHIGTCNNNPDNNPLTWDSAPGFTSICDEANDRCTTGTNPLTHACDMARCNAECITNADCTDLDPHTTDACTNGCTCTHTYVPYCGDGSVNLPNEQCELPNTINNPACPNPGTTTCSGHKLGTRDQFTNCGPGCACAAPDSFVYSCVAGQCGAECSAGQTQTQQCGDSGVGQCKLGIQVRSCTDGCTWGDWGQCTGTVEPSPEICDGKDNNCDGQIDENLTRSCGAEQCGGIQTCSMGNWGTCQSGGSDAGICAKCDSHGNIIYDPTQNSDCNDSQYCNGQERCIGIGTCSIGTPIICPATSCGVNGRCDESLDSCVYDSRDCSAFNLPAISACNNNPDNNPFTFDSAPLFTSQCIDGRGCTVGTRNITHVCDQQNCGAECILGDTDTKACGSDVGECQAGIQTRSCTNGCSWGSFGQCTGTIGPASEVCDGKDNNCNGHIDEGNLCGPHITSLPGTQQCLGKASETSNIYTYQVTAVAADDYTLTYSLVESPNGMTINSATGLIEFPLTRESVGLNNVIVKVEKTGFRQVNSTCPALVAPVCAQSGDSFRNICELTAAGQDFWHTGYCYDLQSYNLDICKPGEEIYPRRKYGFEQLDILNAEPVCAGDTLRVILTLENNGIWDNKDVKVTLVIADLDVRKTVGPFRLDAGDETTKIMDLDLPAYADEGMHDVRAYIYSDSGDFHRIKHREFLVKQCDVYSCSRDNPVCTPGVDC